MEAIRIITRVPKNHVIEVKIPEHIPENALVEIIVLFGFQQSEQEALEMIYLQDKEEDSKTDRTVKPEFQGQEGVPSC